MREEKKGIPVLFLISSKCNMNLTASFLQYLSKSQQNILATHSTHSSQI